MLKDRIIRLKIGLRKMANNSDLDLDELKSNLRDIVANRFEEYMVYAKSLGLRMTTLHEHLAEVWSWDPDTETINEHIKNNKEKEVA